MDIFIFVALAALFGIGSAFLGNKNRQKKASQQNKTDKKPVVHHKKKKK